MQRGSCRTIREALNIQDHEIAEIPFYTFNLHFKVSLRQVNIGNKSITVLKTRYPIRIYQEAVQSMGQKKTTGPHVVLVLSSVVECWEQGQAKLNGRRQV